MDKIIDEEKAVFDEEQVYKNLTFYHVTVRDYYTFLRASECLKERKNRSSEKKIIKMSYLKYLFYKINQEVQLGNSITYIKLNYLLLLTLGRNEQERKNIDIVFDFDNTCMSVNGNIINENDFEKIKQIIFHQNYVEFDINLSQDMEDAMSMVNKINKGDNNVDIEDLCISYHLGFGTDYKDIYKLPIKKFLKGISKLRKKTKFETLTYLRWKSGETNIDDWFGHETNKPDYSKYFTSSKNLKDKVN